MSLRKIIKTRGSFPNEEAALKLLYLALRNHSKNWSTVQSWREALNRFQILWPDRMPRWKGEEAERIPRNEAPPQTPGFIACGRSRIFKLIQNGQTNHPSPVSALNGARVASPHRPILRQALSNLSQFHK